MNDDLDTVLAMFALYLVAKAVEGVQWYETTAVPAIERGGARVYDALHDDAGHKRDLPRPERMDSTVRKKVAALTALAKKVGFPNPELAAAIAMAESGGNPHSVARTPRETSVGLWQINILAHKQYSEDYLKNEVDNARAALKISKGGKDWRPWGAYTNGSYKRYLPTGGA